MELLEVYKRKASRERQSREEAEKILEEKSRELFEAHEELQEKSDRLAELNQEFVDSLNYAQRIQEALLPNTPKVKEMFTDMMVLFQPKDIVSGDFYWIEEVGDVVVVAAADCTGHGVPGAFMSIIGSNGLTKAVMEEGLIRPSEILNFLDGYVSRALNRNVNEHIKDGLDIAVCAIHKSTCKLEFAGAYNPLYCIRKGELIEIKGDRFAVGSANQEDLVFENHEFQIEPEDAFYIFSDGYADQFGGPRGKKLKYRAFKDLLLSIAELPMEIQKEDIKASLDAWQGELEQIDDIVLVGFKA